MQDVEIRSPGAEGNPADIIVGGEKVRGVAAYSLISAHPRERTRLVLDLGVQEIDYHGQADVWISDRVRETLIRFGWTPPPADMAKESGQ